MPSSRTSPAACAGSSEVEQVVLVDVGRRPRASARSNSRPITAAVRSVATVSLGQPLQPPGQHLLDRRSAGAPRRPAGRGRRARRPAGRTRRGRTGCRRCAAAARSACVRRTAGCRPPSSNDLGDRVGAARPVSSSRTACRRASASATSASAPVGSGWARQVATTSSRLVGRRSRRAAAAPAGWRCRPSAGRRGRPAGAARAAASRTVRTSRSQERNCAPASSASGSAPGAPAPSRSSTCRHGHSGGAPSSWEQRPTSTSTPAAPGHRGQLGTSRDLPMPGSPVSTAYVGAPVSRGVERTGERLELLVAADHRPRRQRGSDRARRARPGRGRRDAAARRGRRRAATQSRAGSCRSTAVWRSRSSAPGSRPSSSSSTVAHLAQHVERVGLAPGPGQRERPQAPTAARAAGAPRSAPRARRRRSPWWPSARLGDGRGPRGPPAAAPRAGPAPRPPRRVLRARRTASRATSASASSSRRPPRRARRPRTGRADRSGRGSQRRGAAARTADSKTRGVEAVVGDPQRVAGRDGHQHGGRGRGAPGPARAPGAGRRRTPAAWR